MSIIDREEFEELLADQLPYKNLKDKSVLITGATGMIGRYLTEFLLYLNEQKRMNMRISIICRNKQRAAMLFADALTKDYFQIIEGDLCQKLPENLPFFHYIIHGAGNNHPVAFAQEPVQTFQTAVFGTMNLLEHEKKFGQKEPGTDGLPLRNHGMDGFVLLSTGEIYGAQTEYHESCDETIPGAVESMRCRSCYPEGKRASETLLSCYCAQYGMRAMSARLGYVYGPTMQPESSKADVQFFRKAQSGENILLKSAGLPYRSYMYVQDAVRGILTILLKGKAGEAYNVSNGDSCTTIRGLAEKIAKEAGVSVEFANPSDAEERGASNMQREVLNSEKLCKLGFKPRVSLEKGISRTLRALQRQENK